MSLSNLLVSNNYTLFGGSSATGSTGSTGPAGFSWTGPDGVSVTGPGGVNYTGKTGNQGVDVGLTGPTGESGSNVGWTGATGAAYAGIGTGAGGTLYSSPAGVAGWNTFLVTGSLTGNGASNQIDVQNSAVSADTYVNGFLTFDTKGRLTTPSDSFGESFVQWSQNQTVPASITTDVQANNLNANYYYKNPNAYVNTATGVFTCPYDGAYMMFCTAIFPNNSAGTRRRVNIELNGTSVAQTSCPALSVILPINTCANFYLDAGDVLNASISQNTSSSIIATVNTSIYYLGK